MITLIRGLHDGSNFCTNARRNCFARAKRNPAENAIIILSCQPHHSRFGCETSSARTDVVGTIPKFWTELPNFRCTQKRTLWFRQRPNFVYIVSRGDVVDRRVFVFLLLFNKSNTNRRRVLLTNHNDAIARIKVFCVCVYVKNVITLLWKPSAQSWFSQSSFYPTETVRFAIVRCHK